MWIIIFKMLKIFPKNEIKGIFEGKYWIFQNTLFVEMNFKSLINYSTIVC
jgi:hypothetical protein